MASFFYLIHLRRFYAISRPRYGLKQGKQHFGEHLRRFTDNFRPRCLRIVISTEKHAYFCIEIHTFAYHNIGEKDAKED